MKKIIYPILLSTILLTACKKEENKIQQPMTDPPTESVQDTPDSVAEDSGSTSNVSFKYAEADQFAKEFVNFVNDYKAATQNNDSEALKVLGPKLNEYQVRAVELTKRVPQDEAVKFQDFINGLERSLK